MKNILHRTGYLTLAISLIIIFFSCSKENTVAGQGNNRNAHIENLRNQVNDLPKESLNPAELASLAFIREEEKMARDVYITLNGKWGVNVFSNISSSEQTHMDAVLLLFNKYGLPDPAGNNAIGIFKNTALQNLYNQLVEKGNTSKIEAFIVGATIEDLDLFDLNTALTRIDNQDIRVVYEMLAKGSRNHLRAFYRNILSSGGTYKPQYITQQEFDEIVSSGMETGY